MQVEPLFADADVISTYTARQAVEDGILVEVGLIGSCPIYITRHCFHDLELEDEHKRKSVVGEALESLKQPDREDDGYRKLRAFEVDERKVWVILDGQGVTITLPEDY